LDVDIGSQGDTKTDTQTNVWIEGQMDVQADGQTDITFDKFVGSFWNYGMTQKQTLLFNYIEHRKGR
jgi:hypothetical protein